MPFHVNDHRAESMGDRTLDELMPLAHDPNSNLAEIVPAVDETRAHAGPGIDRLPSTNTSPYREANETTTLQGGALISAFCFSI
jgi:hypothetical protein